jgi:GntR family transcriptional regulator
MIHKGETLIEHIKVDFQKKEPIYFQIEEQIKFLIATGELQPGDQLPPVRELADALEVNFNTIARVYRLLDRQGIVSTQQGRGCYVLESALPESERKRAMLESLADHFLLEGKALGFTSEQILHCLENKMYKKK